MAINIDKVLGNMTTAISEVVSGEWPGIKSCVEQALHEEKETLKILVEAFETGDLTEEELQSQLEDEKLALESAMLVCKVKTKVMAQNAANAAIEALTSAIKLVL